MIVLDAQGKADAAARAKRWAAPVRADAPTMADARALVASVLSGSGIEAVTIVAGFLLERDARAREAAQAAEFEARKAERRALARQVQAAIGKMGDESPVR